MYKCLFISLFIVISQAAFADIPTVNLYQVKKRFYDFEPQARQYTVSANDEAYPVKPSIDTYTHFDPANPKSLFTITPYAKTEFLPKLGLWMVIKNVNAMPTYQYPQGKIPTSASTQTVPAHWISLTNARGQYIIEPINFVFVVYGKSAKAAGDQLHHVMQKIGFGGTATINHSGGYMAYFGDQLLGQLSNDKGLGYTYSNNDFRYQNDHFRLMGGYPVSIKNQQAYLFMASASEESGYESDLAKLSQESIHQKLNEIDKTNPANAYYENDGHHYVSFSNARNNLAVALIQAGYPTYFVAFSNVVNTLGESTGDHDGNVYVTEIA